MNVTTRLGRLEKASAYQLRILKLYNEFCRLPEETDNADALRGYSDSDALAIFKMIVAVDILQKGREQTRAEMVAEGYHEYWIDWLMNGVMEEADIAAHVPGCSLMRVSDEALIAEADKRLSEREATA